MGKNDLTSHYLLCTILWLVYAVNDLPIVVDGEEVLPAFQIFIANFSLGLENARQAMGVLGTAKHQIFIIYSASPQATQKPTKKITRAEARGRFAKPPKLFWCGTIVSIVIIPDASCSVKFLGLDRFDLMGVGDGEARGEVKVMCPCLKQYHRMTKIHANLFNNFFF